MYRKSLFGCIVAVMLFLGAPHAEANSGFYIGLGAAYNTFGGGDLDGSQALSDGREVIILPDLDSAVGFDLLLGQRMNDAWAIEFNFMSSAHNGTWEGLKGDSTYTSVSFNGKYSFLRENRVRPYLLLGLGYQRLLIKKGAADIYTGAVADASLYGYGLNFGTGIDIYLNQKVSVTMGVLYRYLEYTEAAGVHQSASIDDGVDGSGFSFLLTTAYHF